MVAFSDHIPSTILALSLMLLMVAFSDHIPSTILALCAKKISFFNIFDFIVQKYWRRASRFIPNLIFWGFNFWHPTASGTLVHMCKPFHPPPPHQILYSLDSLGSSRKKVCWDAEILVNCRTKTNKIFMPNFYKFFKKSPLTIMTCNLLNGVD